jgi:hypothetical protein
VNLAWFLAGFGDDDGGVASVFSVRGWWNFQEIILPGP